VLRYIGRRTLILIPTLLAISMVTFVVIQLPPGDFLSSRVAELQAHGDGSLASQELDRLTKR
jgi:peptide/nickel transport system permease protein